MLIKIKTNKMMISSIKMRMHLAMKVQNTNQNMDQTIKLQIINSNLLIKITIIKFVEKNSQEGTAKE